jgi:ABC-2 type transport system permease protein
VGPLTRGHLVVADLVVLTGASAVIGVATAATFLLLGEATDGSLLYGAGTGLVTLTFAAVGALTAQLFTQRRKAAGVAGLTLGVAYLVRMVADGSKSADWLRWLSPLGWVEELQAFAGNALVPLIPLALAPAALTAVAFVLARRRDLGEGTFRDRDTARPRLQSVRHPLGFAWRERRGGLVGWGAGVAILGLATGFVTGAFTDVISSSPEFQEQAAKYGFAELASVAGFVASTAPFTAIVLCLYVVSSIHVLGEDESDGRLDLVYSTRVRRLDWLSAQAATIVGAVVAIGIATSIATWLGVVLGNADLSLGDAFVATFNVLPLAALTLGVAVLVHGVRPGLMVPVTGGAVVIAYLLDFLGPVVDLPNWVLDLSPFHHVALAPVQPVAWTATIVMLVVALVTLVVGALAYARRDLV